MKKRKYQLHRRAEKQNETREKIVEAIVKLHEDVGPRATTISAIAEEAGVQRLTVYRHFPDDVALFAACSSHWLTQHPLPDRTIWRQATDWRSRCRAALSALYPYYRHNARMLASVFRDADLAAMRAPMEGFAAYFAKMRGDLVGIAPPSLAQSPAFAATIGHALSFATWQSLADSFTDNDMVDLVMTWLDGVAAGSTLPD